MADVAITLLPMLLPLLIIIA